METHKLTVRLPADEVAFVKRYARQHGVTVTEVLHRYLDRLRNAGEHEIHPDVAGLAGILPGDMDVRDEYLRAMQDKHQ